MRSDRLCARPPGACCQSSLRTQGLAADAIEKVGKDGVVNVEEGQTFGMDLEFTEGMQFDKGYILVRRTKCHARLSGQVYRRGARAAE